MKYSYKLFKYAFPGVTILSGAAIFLGPDKRFPLYSSAKSNAKSLQKELLADCKPYDFNWDGMNSQQSFATRHIFFIRHGQYVYSNDDYNCNLTSKGHKQTELTGLQLRKLDFPYNKIVYSTMTRAEESMKEVCKSLPDVPTESCEGIREGAVFPPDPPVPNWPMSAQDFEKDGERIETAFKKLMHRASADQKEDSFEIYVCHANVIRYFVCRLLQVPPNAWIRMTLDHGSITYVTIRPNGVTSLKWLGNSGFLPSELLTVS